MLLGNKNQKKPTLTVNKHGKINVTKVMFIPNPSLRDHPKRRSVKTPSIAIDKNLMFVGKRRIPIKPNEQIIEEIMNLFLFDI